ncbi:MAG: BatA domain-containing protein, partial [Chloroflexales bacterium]
MPGIQHSTFNIQHSTLSAVGVSVMLSAAKHLPGSWMGRPLAALGVTWGGGCPGDSATFAVLRIQHSTFAGAPMSLISPLALLGAAIVGPIIVAMYLLKLRREERSVSSTFLWQRMVRDVEANAPWQKLRRSL